MSTTSNSQIEKYLRDYSAYVDYWDADAGDTHELLGSREILHSSIGSMSAHQLTAMRESDNKVLDMVNAYHGQAGWDIAMLRKTAEIIVGEQESIKKAA